LRISTSRCPNAIRACRCCVPKGSITNLRHCSGAIMKVHTHTSDLYVCKSNLYIHKRNTCCVPKGSITNSAPCCGPIMKVHTYKRDWHVCKSDLYIHKRDTCCVPKGCITNSQRCRGAIMKVQHLRVFAKMTCIYAKETCICSKETCIYAKETCIYAKETYKHVSLAQSQSLLQIHRSRVHKCKSLLQSYMECLLECSPTS